MSKELQEQLKPGDQIIATEDVFYQSIKGADGSLVAAQRKGDILLVNNTAIRRNKDGVVTYAGTEVGGVRTFESSKHDGRSGIGLGASFRVGTFRLATPDDPGYLATRDQWSSIKDMKVLRMRCESFLWGTLAFLSLGALALGLVP